MPELFVTEKLESELQSLYLRLDKTSNIHGKGRIQQAIQDRNLQFIKIMPNE